LCIGLTSSRGESGLGTWTVIVKDTKTNEHSGTFTDWHFKLWGECIDTKIAHLLPMPAEEDDNDHALIPTITASAATTSITKEPTTDVGGPVTKPADHPDRPTKIQATTTEAGSPTMTGSPTGTGLAQETTAASSSWISWLPFGTSKTARVWIYGALGLIVAFCSGLGIYLWLARRRRLRNNPRDDYEFELLHEDETQGLNGGEKGVAAGKRKTRGGELYDAFAGGSDDEDDFGDGYRDQVGRDEPQHVIGEDDEEDDDVEDDEEDDDVDEKADTRLMGGR
jgi:kexin